MELFTGAEEDLDKGNFSEVAEKLLYLPDEIEKVLPVLIPAIKPLIEDYLNALKPLVDETEGLITQITQHICDTTAKSYATMMRSLRDNDFSREEAMAILLTRIQTRGQTAGAVTNSLKNSSGDLIQKIKNPTLPLSPTDQMAKLLGKYS